ncbi:LCP family protein [Streptomyces sp. YGL11-2]|uniref:LCP family protein n=1 Tax=Streptomyces sp. YGL11-2 TaxID=3414028 RepID=UPI003CF172BE
MGDKHAGAAGRGQGRAANRQGGRRTKGGTRTPRGTVVARTLAGVVSVAVLATSGVSWAAYHWLSGSLNISHALDPLLGRGPKHLDGSVNLLLIGLDSRKDMNGKDLPDWVVKDELHAGSAEKNGFYNTNTLILMHIPADGGKVQAFSIPRDSYVETHNADDSVQGHYKIKEAYGNAYEGRREKLVAQGEKGAKLEADSREAGRAATLATLQNLLGVPIDHFAEVNLIGFYDIADQLKPIEVCLKHPVKDKNSGADFPAGRQELNAKQALAFVRQRHGLPNEDIDRTHRQQAYLSSITHKLKTQGVFEDLGKMQGLFGVMKKDLVIDSQLNPIDFSQQATNLTGGNVVFHTLPVGPPATRNHEDVMLADPEKMRRLVQDAFHEGPAASPGAGGGTSDSKSSGSAKAAPGTVDVLNGSGKTGAAAEELKALKELGYTAGTSSNTVPQPHATVTYGQGGQAAAQQIAVKLGATAAPAASSNVPAGHVRVTLGQDFTSPTSPSPAQSPSTSSPESSPSSDASDGDYESSAVKAGGVPCVN